MKNEPNLQHQPTSEAPDVEPLVAALGRYQIGVWGPQEAPLTLRELNASVLAAREAVTEAGFPGVAFDDSRVRDIPAVRRWLSLKNSLKHPLDLSQEAKKELALFNLALESESDRGQYIVGSRIMKPSEARNEISDDGSISKYLISMSVYQAKAIIETSSLWTEINFRHASELDEAG
jgi:hypothetical protein